MLNLEKLRQLRLRKKSSVLNKTQTKHIQDLTVQKKKEISKEMFKRVRETLTAFRGNKMF